MSGIALVGAGAAVTVLMHVIGAIAGLREDVLVADSDRAGVTVSGT